MSVNTVLNNKNLLRSQAFIGGQWIDSSDQFDILNPYNGEILSSCPDLGAKETKKAIEIAKGAFEKWKKSTATERSECLRKWYELILENQDDLARILTLEQGKPLAEAKGEILYGASFIEWFSEEAKRIYGDVIPPPANDRRIVTIKQPVGVVAAITPWNFPNAMITRKVGPALAAGCTVVVKPAGRTPLSALALAELSREAGIPAGVFNVLTTRQTAVVGQELSTNPLVSKISFTGSTAVGKLLMKQSAETVKRVSMELGGNSPFIVFDDADIEAAVEGAIASKYRNAGQTCVCANRIFVQNSVYEEFVGKLKEASFKLKMGDGMDDGVQIGPLIDQSAAEFINDLLKDAVGKGAEVTYAREPVANGNMFPPTLVEKAHKGMDIHEEEIFGPVSVIYSFDKDNEVIEMANDTPYGLASYFYGRDNARIWRVAEALDYGIVGINTGMISTTVAPFGGVKESGVGREGSKYGIDEYLEIKYLAFAGLNF